MSQKQIEKLFKRWVKRHGSTEFYFYSKGLSQFLSDNGCVVAKEIIDYNLNTKFVVGTKIARIEE